MTNTRDRIEMYCEIILETAENNQSDYNNGRATTAKYILKLLQQEAKIPEKTTWIQEQIETIKKKQKQRGYHDD